jgi:WD40 repeat protein
LFLSVHFNHFLFSIISTAGDDGCIRFWDYRSPVVIPSCEIPAHESASHISVEWMNSAMFCSLGINSNDGKDLKIWDSRKLSKPIFSQGLFRHNTNSNHGLLCFSPESSLIWVSQKVNSRKSVVKSR